MRHLHRRQSDAQTSRTLVQSVIASNFAQDGDPAEGQTPSAISTNNFINFCAGQNVTDGSNSGQQNCNPAPIGLIPSTENLPSVKISSPRNGDILPSDSTFTVSVASNNFAGGFATNPGEAYMTAPQQLDRQGNIMGHYHLVIEQLSSFNQTTPTSPETFAFVTEIFTTPPAVDVTDGLSPGSYRAFVSLHTSNHQPVMLPVSQHGSVNDAVYFTVEESVNVIQQRRSIRRRRQAQTAPVPPPPAKGVVQYKAKRQDTPATSRDLVSSAIATSFSNDGMGTPVTGLVSSLTSTNNYINFCAAFSNIPLTNGEQVRQGSCNPAPLGVIVPRASIPSSKFLFPTFGTVWTENQPFAVSVIVNNFEGGFRTNSATNYMAAPQQLTEEGIVRGYVVISIEEIPSFTSTEPTDPSRFTWFEALSVQGRGGGWSTIIDSGLPSGIYRLSTSLRAENHQPILASTSVGGATGDVVYFTVVGEGGAANGTETAFPSSVVIPDRTSSGGPKSTSSGTAAGDSANSDGSSPVNVGAIAGGVVAGIAALCLVVFLVIFFLRKRKASRQQIHSDLEPHAFIRGEGNMVYSGGGTGGMSYSGSSGAGMNYSATGTGSMNYPATGNASTNYSATGNASMNYSGEGTASMNHSAIGNAGRTFSGEDATTYPSTLGSPPPFASPNTSSSPYSLVSPDTSRSTNSSAPVSNSTSSQSRPNAYVSEKRLPQVPRSPDRSSVVSAAPSYRTTA